MSRLFYRRRSVVERNKENESHSRLHNYFNDYTITPLGHTTSFVIKKRRSAIKGCLIGCCGCCNALRPRYKRLVDSIFPVIPQDGLVKSNMEKLTFYSLSSPEKLDRIGEYFYQKASRDIYRRRYEFAIIAMEAMDQLLVACHAQTLNLFVESYLKMVQKLLESTEPKLQILATQSFVKFANIEEDTPSYHRRYDFFVSKFSAMCHNNEGDLGTKNHIRLAGIQGLQAVVRKTVSDDLVENIWEPVHMDKIVPSLLFNMQESGFHMKEVGSAESAPEDQVDPPMLAESCLRELVGRASFGHIKAVLRPVLRHFDLHKLWCPNQFAVHTFRIIIFSIQAQYSYTVVETLMAHLDENSKSHPSIRTSIADVLSKIIAIAAGESVGPSVLEIINSLLSHLRDSVKNGINQSEEKQYQEALINALGEFANHLPDYQKIEIMMFIMSKIPFPPNSNQTEADNLLQNILLKSLLKVGTKYQTIHFNSTFPVSFLEPLLRMSLVPDPEMRLLVQKILHTLIDRHNNLEKLSNATVSVMDLDLVLEKSSRPDLIFINKHGPVIYDALYTSLQMETNAVENIEAIYTTIALLCVELASAEVVIDIIQLLLGIQNLANTNSSLTEAQVYNLHALVISILMLISVVSDLPSLKTYCSDIIQVRRQSNPFLLPEMYSHYSENKYTMNQKEPLLMLEKTKICEMLKEDGLDPSRLTQSSPYGAGGPGVIAASSHRHSWVESSARGSVVDIGSGQDVDSASSSPGVQKVNEPSSINATPINLYPRHSSWDGLLSFPDSINSSDQSLSSISLPDKLPEEKLNFEHMKRVLAESSESKKEAEAERREELNNFFRTATFAEIVQRTKPKHEDLQTKLHEIFSSLSTPDIQKSPSDSETPVYERNFPEMFAF